MHLTFPRVPPSLSLPLAIHANQFTTHAPIPSHLAQPAPNNKQNVAKRPRKLKRDKSNRRENNAGWAPRTACDMHALTEKVEVEVEGKGKDGGLPAVDNNAGAPQSTTEFEVGLHGFCTVHA